MTLSRIAWYPEGRMEENEWKVLSAGWETGWTGMAEGQKS